MICFGAIRQSRCELKTWNEHNQLLGRLIRPLCQYFFAHLHVRRVMLGCAVFIAAYFYELGSRPRIEDSVLKIEQASLSKVGRPLDSIVLVSSNEIQACFTHLEEAAQLILAFILLQGVDFNDFYFFWIALLSSRRKWGCISSHQRVVHRFSDLLCIFKDDAAVQALSFGCRSLLNHCFVELRHQLAACFVLCLGDPPCNILVRSSRQSRRP